MDSSHTDSIISSRTGVILLTVMMAGQVVNTVTVAAGAGQTFILFYAAAGIAAIFYSAFRIYTGLRAGSLRPELHDILLLALLIWSVIATVFAADPKTSFWGTDYRNDGLYSYLIYAGIYACARQIKDRGYRLWIVRAFVLMVSFMSLLTLTQAVFAVPDVPKVSALYASGLSNINHFAYLLCMAVAGGAGLAVTEEKLWCRITFGVLSAFNMWALIINGTMGSYLAALAGIVMLTAILIIRDSSMWCRAGAVAVMLLAVNILCNVFMEDMILKNFSSSFDGIEMTEDGLEISDGAGSQRMGLWRQAVEYIGERPVLGFGPEGLYERYYADGFSNDRPHNEYLQYAVFLGIPGLLMYLAALVSLAARRLRDLRRAEPLMAVIGSVILTYCMSAFFGNTMYYTGVYYWMILGLL